MMQSSPFTYRRIVIWIGRLTLGGIFVYAGYSKIFYPTHILSPLFAMRFAISANLQSFAEQVKSYQLLSPSGVTFVAHTLPFTEVVLGFLLLIGWRLRIWASLVSLIMLGFFSAVVRSYAMGLQINCGCFATPEPLTGMTIVRDGVLVALAIVMTVFAFQEARQPHPWSAPEKASA